MVYMKTSISCSLSIMKHVCCELTATWGTCTYVLLISYLRAIQNIFKIKFSWIFFGFSSTWIISKYREMKNGNQDIFLTKRVKIYRICMKLVLVKQWTAEEKKCPSLTSENYNDLENKNNWTVTLLRTWMLCNGDTWAFCNIIPTTLTAFKA